MLSTSAVTANSFLGLKVHYLSADGWQLTSAFPPCFHFLPWMSQNRPFIQCTPGTTLSLIFNKCCTRLATLGTVFPSRSIHMDFGYKSSVMISGLCFLRICNSCLLAFTRITAQSYHQKKIRVHNMLTSGINFSIKPSWAFWQFVRYRKTYACCPARARRKQTHQVNSETSNPQNLMPITLEKFCAELPYSLHTLLRAAFYPTAATLICVSSRMFKKVASRSQNVSFALRKTSGFNTIWVSHFPFYSPNHYGVLAFAVFIAPLCLVYQRGCVVAAIENCTSSSVFRLCHGGA